MIPELTQWLFFELAQLDDNMNEKNIVIYEPESLFMSS